MRRWNGWGDETKDYPVKAGILGLLKQFIGLGTAPKDVGLADVLDKVPASRLPQHDLISTDPELRIRHTRGQSFADLVATRSGDLGQIPDGVALPQTSQEVRQLLTWASTNNVTLIPYGGGTSVAGHINPVEGERPILTVSLAKLNRLLEINPTARLARFGAGIKGPDLEAQLRALGFTLGHFPQSFELSTLGGWIATRSSGQQSLGFGRIEQLWAGGRVETPQGALELAPFPASAAGPDLREMLLGSEGRYGIITEATVRIRPIPELDVVHAVFFANWQQAQTAARAIAQAHVPLGMLRLSTPTETMTNLALAGHERAIGLLESFLKLRGVGAEKCMLLVGFIGSKAQVALSRHAVLSLARQHGGVHIGQTFGKAWQAGRFRAPYLRNRLWELGYGVDTVETATTWENVDSLLQQLEHSLRNGLAAEQEQVHVFTHLSHFYSTGSSIYTTYVFRLGDDAQATMARWQKLKTAASQAIVAAGGTISHQHGVGLDHRPYLEAEKGRLGIGALQQLGQHFDPAGLLNPAKLYEDGQ
ncbi:FAD-binding oxidoreductase [Herpetosiphon llansteffanensis]|uniref:FAD-binding oxidoreductase n=1 Tax=Herpetosiphon llansteffanensis TaxID=2094568 RepID=UPI000D7BAEC2|nr:FAD-binding oxidoreductase [Herpetosiphon llansteffanensis]